MEIIATIDTAIGAAKGAIDLVKSLRGMRGKQPPELTAAFDKISSAQQAILEAKQMVFALIEENAALKKRLGELERHDAERQHYQLQAIGPGAFAYVSQEAASDGKQVPWLCQSCFEEAKKSVLQLVERKFYHDAYQCPRCSTTLLVPNNLKPAILTSKSRYRFDSF